MGHRLLLYAILKTNEKSIILTKVETHHLAFLQVGTVKRTVACHPASADWRRVYSLAGNLSRREADTMLLSDLGSIASIVGLILTIVFEVRANRKK